MQTFSPQQYAAELLKMGEAMRGHGSQAAITRCAQFLKAAVGDASPKRLSGVGRRGAKLGVKYADVTPWGDGGWQTIVSVTGPYALIERDTRPHTEPRFHHGNRTRIAFGGSVYSRVHHPGTKGKHIFERTVLASEPALERIYQEETDSVLRQLT